MEGCKIVAVVCIIEKSCVNSPEFLDSDLCLHKIFTVSCRYLYVNLLHSHCFYILIDSANSSNAKVIDEYIGNVWR